MNRRDRLVTAFWLAVLAYLGFYVFGLVMGVYAPGDVLYFTIPAGVLACALVLHVIRSRRAAAAVRATVSTDEGFARAEHKLREKRGW
jgi:hypothetical protein